MTHRGDFDELLSLLLSYRHDGRDIEVLNTHSDRKGDRHEESKQKENLELAQY